MTRLSNRQYPMLKMFYDLGRGFMGIEDAAKWDQRPFRSMLIRRWVAFRPGHGFHITDDGKSALHEFLGTDIARKNSSLPLTAYFDPSVYRLSARDQVALHLIKAAEPKRRGEAA